MIAVETSALVMILLNDEPGSIRQSATRSAYPRSSSHLRRGTKASWKYLRHGATEGAQAKDEEGEEVVDWREVEGIGGSNCFLTTMVVRKKLTPISSFRFNLAPRPLSRYWTKEKTSKSKK